MAKNDLKYRLVAAGSQKQSGPATWNDEERSVEVVGATEHPATIYDYERGLVDEVLLMDGLEMPGTRQVPLLNTHSRYDTSSVIGSFRDMEIVDGQLIGRVFFSGAESVNETALKVKEGHITDFSAGYRAVDSTWIADGERSVIRGREFTGPLLVTTRWRIKELSVVPIGADEHATARGEAKEVEPEPEQKREEPAEPATTMESEVEMTEEINVDQLREDAQKAERERVADILAIASRHGYEKEAEGYIRDGKTVREFSSYVLNEIADNGRRKAVPGDAEIDMTEKEVKRYSLLNVVRALTNPSPANQAAAAFERECSDAAEKKTGRVARGFLIPDDVIHRGQADNLSTRDMTAGTGSAGGYLVETKHGSMIEMLTNSMVVANLGAVQLRNLDGDLDIPRQSSGGTGYWIGEGNDATESTPALAMLSLRPKTVAAYTDVTRRLERQSSVDVENFIRMDLMRSLALEIDQTCFNGTGTPSEPMGIINVTGVGSVTLNAANAPDFGDIIDLETAVATDNALAGSLAYVTNATIIGNMKQTVRVSTSDSRMVLEDMNNLNGYRCVLTNQMPAKYILFGNWADLIIGYWGGMDVNIDTASLSTSGGKRIVVMQDCDMGLRHVESMAVGYKA